MYLSVYNRADVDFRESFKYATNRFFAYLGAEFLGLIVLMIVMFLWMFKIPSEVLLATEEFSFSLLWTFGFPLLVLVPPGLVFGNALYIMSWDDTGFRTALQSAYGFIRSYFLSFSPTWLGIRLTSHSLTVQYSPFCERSRVLRISGLFIFVSCPLHNYCFKAPTTKGWSKGGF